MFYSVVSFLMARSMEFRMSPSLRPLSKVCNPPSSQCSDIDLSIHGSRSFVPVSISSAIDVSQELGSLDSTTHACQFPTLQAAKKISFKAKPGAKASRVLEGFSISPATPVFQSEYCKAMVGAYQSVPIEVPYVKINPSIGSSGFHTIPNLEPKQKGVEFANCGSSSVTSSEKLNPDDSGRCLGAAESSLDDRLHVLDSTMKIQDAGTDLLPSGALPLDAASLVEGLTPVSQGVKLEGHPVGSHRGQVQLPPKRSEGDVPRTKSGLGLPNEHAGGPTGITWSAVVTKHNHEVFSGIGVALSCHWLMKIH